MGSVKLFPNLAAALKGVFNRVVTTLLLRNNNIGNEGAKAIAEALNLVVGKPENGQDRVDAAIALAPSTPMELYPRLRVVKTALTFSASAIAMAPSSPMLLPPR